MSMKEHVMFAYNTIKYTFSNSRITPYGGLLIPGQMLKAVDFDPKSRIIRTQNNFILL